MMAMSCLIHHDSSKFSKFEALLYYSCIIAYYSKVSNEENTKIHNFGKTRARVDFSKSEQSHRLKINRAVSRREYELVKRLVFQKLRVHRLIHHKKTIIYEPI
jgi:hypothetical protein